MKRIESMVMTLIQEKRDAGGIEAGAKESVRAQARCCAT